MAIGGATAVERNQAVPFTEIDDVVVMMDVDVGRYYGPDETGASFRVALESSASVAAVRAALRRDYEAAPAVRQRDARSFAAEAHRCGVIRILATGDEATAPASA